MIPVTATAAQLERAFGVSLIDYRLPGGRVAYANATAPKIAASVAPVVQGVLGLNDLHQAQPESLERAPAGPAQRPSLSALPKASKARPAATGPQPCTDASNTWPDTINVFADYYGMSQLYGLGDLGQGQKIALLELPFATPSAHPICWRFTPAVHSPFFSCPVSSSAPTRMSPRLRPRLRAASSSPPAENFRTCDIAAAVSHDARFSSRCVLSGDSSPENSATAHPFRDGKSLIAARTYFLACRNGSTRAKHGRSSSSSSSRFRSAVAVPILAAAAASVFCFVTQT
jgi:hypothetical protein